MLIDVCFSLFCDDFSCAVQFELRNGRERRISDLVRITDALAGWGVTSSSRSANHCETTFLLLVRGISLFLHGYHLVASATGVCPSTRRNATTWQCFNKSFSFSWVCVVLASFH